MSHPPRTPGVPALPRSRPQAGSTKVVVAVVAGVVLVCAGLVTVVVRVAVDIGATVDEGLQPDRPATTLEVEEGDAFAFEDFRFDAGWALSGRAVTADTPGRRAVRGLRVTHTGGPSGSGVVTTPHISITLEDDGEVVAEVGCTVPEHLAPGDSAAPTCLVTSGRLPQDHDRLTVHEEFVRDGA
ncbi:hypothetical protein FE634_04850 [Nocardioides dongxiaopingii]|uniref:hypothetical protein n=1 Tax=Nocardioides sp. S-1144 TaxID=2582905 RepID=UPI0011625BDF|nr:hypothetical protein [Nocardioides sp. S-1144]QCW49910.2 hypothetical protein FE634_04850 [Nocardioides sp. S-1144]